MFHCDGGCHTHTVETFDGVASGSLAAPDHEYPAHLELRLTATDSEGAATTVARRLDPETVVLRFESNVPGVKVTVGDKTGPTPLVRTVIVGSQNSVGAPTPQVIGGESYSFQEWSDGGSRLHTITAPTSAKTYTASFAANGTTTLQLSDLPFVSASNGWGPVERDQSNGENAADDGGTLRINGASYARGLGVHAASDVRIAIPSGCTTFRAIIGVDDEVGSNGSVRFKVYADGATLFTSAVKRGTQAGQAITLDVTGRSQLRLWVGSDGSNSQDHADWARARLTCPS
jgi:hypothetical protein